jgi:condensin complex subunit 3
MLNTLTFYPTLEPRLVHIINILLTYHEDQSPFNDDPTLKLFNRFRNKFEKMFSKVLNNSRAGMFLDDEMVQICREINVEPPHGEEGEYVPEGSVASTSRAGSAAAPSRATSVISTTQGGAQR